MTTQVTHDPDAPKAEIKMEVKNEHEEPQYSAANTSEPIIKREDPLYGVLEEVRDSIMQHPTHFKNDTKTEGGGDTNQDMTTGLVHVKSETPFIKVEQD